MDINKIDGTGNPVLTSEKETAQTEVPDRKLSLIERISFYVLTAVIFLLPVVTYAPFSGFSLDFCKKLLFFGGVTAAFVFYLLARFEDGKFVLPKGKMIWVMLSAVASFLISSIFVWSRGWSFGQAVFGTGADTDSFSFIIAAFLLMFLCSVYFQSAKRLSNFYLTLLVSFVIVFVVEAVQIFTGGKILTENGIITNLIGKWNDLGIYFGLGLLLSLSALELLQLGFYPKMLAGLVLVGCIAMLGMVNFSSAWVVVGVFSFIILLYSVFFNGLLRREAGSRLKFIFRPAFIVMAVAIIFFFLQTKIGGVLSSRNIVNIDVRPSFTATFDLTSQTIKESNRNMLFGVGPNRFVSQWVKYKPDAVNNTIFWNVDFNSGIGRIASYGVTLGLFGVLAWVCFLLMLVYLGFRAVFYSEVPKSQKFLIFISFIGTLYLWVFSVIYVPDVVIFALTFIMSGVFFAALLKNDLIEKFEFSFLSDPKIGFASVLVLVLLVITVLSGGYMIGKKFIANYLYQKGIYALNVEGSLDNAEKYLKSAAEYDEQDVYQRNLSNVYILKMGNFVNGQKISDKEAMAKLQEYIVSASAAARKSIDLDSSDYENWLALGRVGEAVVPLKIVDGSYALAIDSYKKAQELSPKNPMIALYKARLEVANGDMEKAKAYLDEALKLKSNFTAALYLLSQIEASQGNLDNAIARAEQAYLFAPNDIGVLFQLGFLKFSDKDYDGAITALERAISVNPQYSNAKYFLGLSYSKVGKNSAALKMFKEIAVSNPDNTEVKQIIRNLTEGRDPFENSAPAPEKRSKLPVSED